MVIVGATASGKSALAHQLALTSKQWAGVDAQIISADAYALYRGMDIGTAKPTNRERSEVAYHQIDVLDIGEVASVAAYQRNARACVEQVVNSRQQPIAVGGSGLYVSALVDDLKFPGSDPAVRARLNAQAEQFGAEAMWERLRQVDPVSASNLHPRNLRRVIRALEVFEITGEPFCATLPSGTYVRPTVVLGLRWQMDQLDERINQRTQRMFDAGFVDEVRHLMVTGNLTEATTASRAVGYREVLQYLAGRGTQSEVCAEVALQTRRLARRQVKWFRRDQRIRWIDVDFELAGDQSKLCDLALQCLSR